MIPNSIYKLISIFIVLSTALQSNANDIFTASYIRDIGIKLNWSPSLDEIADFYILERSFDATNYSQVARIEKKGADGGVPYEHLDVRHLEGFNYYRLTLLTKQDGIIANYIAVEEAYEVTNVVQLYPNPTVGNLTVGAFNTVHEKVNIVIWDKNGRRVFERNNIVLDESWKFDLDLHYLPSGVYTLFFDSDKRLKKNLFQIAIVK